VFTEMIANWAANLMAARRPDAFIGGEKDCYMRRWWVVPRNSFLNIYLHEFLRSDEDRALHDHPYWNVSILLAGEYTEETIIAGGVHKRTIYKAGDLRFRTASGAHRIELHAGSCRTLFITGPRIRHWGFHCPNGWRSWEEFTKPGASNEAGRGCD
jgi:hypothetical protein